MMEEKLKKMSDAVDMISKMPEPILHKILKLIPFKEVARTSVLSRGWEQVWRTYPVIIIDRTIIASFSFNQSVEIQEKRIRAFNCFHQTIRRRSHLMSFEKLEIDIGLGRPIEDTYINRIISDALACNVKFLVLKFNDRSDDVSKRKYNLPPTVLSENSVEVLYLQGCRVRWLSKTNRISKLSSLIKLHMIEVHVNDQAVKSVLAGCPLLEELHLIACLGLETLKLFGHEKLKDIKVYSYNLKCVDLRLINLSFFSVKCGYLDKEFDISLIGCANIKTLEFDGVILNHNWLTSIISQLVFLECLHLCFCNIGEQLKVFSSKLETLKIEHCKDLVKVFIDTPNLRYFTYDGYLINFCFNVPLTLSRMDLCFWTLQIAEEFVKLIELLEGSNGLETLVLRGLNFYCNEYAALDFAKDLAEKLPSPLLRFPNISITFRSPRMMLMIGNWMDIFLWMFPHTKILSLNYEKLVRIVFKISYKKSMVCEGENFDCCKYVPVMCWKQCIEKIDVEVEEVKNEFGSHGKLDPEPRYFEVEGSKFVHKIFYLLLGLGLTEVNMFFKGLD